MGPHAKARRACPDGRAGELPPDQSASGTGQLNAIFEVTPQDGAHIPAALASRAEGYTAISTRL